MASMMDEMAKTLARRRAAAERHTESVSVCIRLVLLLIKGDPFASKLLHEVFFF